MDLNNTENINLSSSKINNGKSNVNKQPKAGEKNFAEELNDVKQNKKAEQGKNEPKENIEKNNKTEAKDPKAPKQAIKNSNIDDAIEGLNDIVNEFVSGINQKDEFGEDLIKENKDYTDKFNNEKKLNEDRVLMENNINFPEQTDKINIQTGSSNMNFNNNEQPFSDFMNNNSDSQILKSTTSELAEEKSILSTMEENIAIANKNMLINEGKNITVQNDSGIKKVDKKTNILVETIVKYDNVVMDRADVEFFANLVENNILDINEIQGAEKSSRVSKTLADLLAKAMNDNKPIRIDFDNNISVIIKIDRAGKISADFLPSSQVAEAYLKENLPLLRQRFDENNIDYNELNQRQRKQQDSQDNRKKGQKDE